MIDEKMVKEASEYLGVSPATIRNWEVEYEVIFHMVRNADDSRSRNAYTDKELEVLNMIKMMRENGIPKQEIIEVLKRSVKKSEVPIEESPETQDIVEDSTSSLEVIEIDSENEIYTPGEAASLIGISTPLLRKYVEYFGIQTEWTKANKTGHRRYNQRHIAELMMIVEKVEKEGWPLEKVRDWLSYSGEEPHSEEEETTDDREIEDIWSKLEELSKENNDLKQTILQQSELLKDSVETVLGHQTKTFERIESLLERFERSQRIAPAALRDIVVIELSALKDEIINETNVETKELVQNKPDRGFFRFFKRNQRERM